MNAHEENCGKEDRSIDGAKKFVLLAFSRENGQIELVSLAQQQRKKENRTGRRKKIAADTMGE